MELIDAINTRRSVRAYAPKPIDKETLDQLLSAAVQAPTGMNAQPWAFGVVTGVDTLRDYAARARTYMLNAVGDAEWFAPYRERASNPDYNMFYNAPVLVVIYAKPTGPIVAETDCHLAAENLMLAARDKGLGSCWIGFATWMLNAPEVKLELGVPAEYKAIAPIVLGYPAGPVAPVEKNPPEVIFWK